MKIVCVLLWAMSSFSDLSTATILFHLSQELIEKTSHLSPHAWNRESEGARACKMSSLCDSSSITGGQKGREGEKGNLLCKPETELSVFSSAAQSSAKDERRNRGIPSTRRVFLPPGRTAEKVGAVAHQRADSSNWDGERRGYQQQRCIPCSVAISKYDNVAVGCIARGVSFGGKNDRAKLRSVFGTTGDKMFTIIQLDLQNDCRTRLPCTAHEPNPGSINGGCRTFTWLRCSTSWLNQEPFSSVMRIAD